MRTFREIAIEIQLAWENISPYAMPYVRAMIELPTSDPSASYGVEQASEQVMRFLANASGWRGNDARRIKAELKAMIGARETLINIEEAIVANGCTYDEANRILQVIAGAYQALMTKEKIALRRDEEVRSSLMKHLGVAHYDANLDEAFKDYLSII